MKIYFCHSRDFDYKNDLYAPIRKSELNNRHEFIFPHESDSITLKTKNIIPTCDIVFAEVSFPATGLGIELGWADAAAVPIVCISREGAKISGSLKFITNNFIKYSNHAELIERIEEILNKYTK